MNPFLEKAQSTQFTEPLQGELKEIFLLSVMPCTEFTEEQKKEIMDAFPPNVLMVAKRIEVMGLPIAFSLPAYLAITALTQGNAGKSMAILIDCLTKHEGETITPDHLAKMYPFGFYNNDTFIDYVDNYLKPKKVKWAEAY